MRSMGGVSTLSPFLQIHERTRVEGGAVLERQTVAQKQRLIGPSLPFHVVMARLLSLLFLLLLLRVLALEEAEKILGDDKGVLVQDLLFCHARLQ
jgi:hypothetical protein